MQYLKFSEVKHKKFFSIDEVFNIGDVLFSKLCIKYSRKYGFSALPVRTNCRVVNVMDDLVLNEDSCSKKELLNDLILQRDAYTHLFPSFNDYISFYCWGEGEQSFDLITPKFNIHSVNLDLPLEASFVGLCSLDNGRPVLLVSSEQFKRRIL